MRVLKEHDKPGSLLVPVHVKAIHLTTVCPAWDMGLTLVLW